MMRIAAAALGLVFLFVGGSAYGARWTPTPPLSASDVQRFVASLDAVRPLGAELQASGKSSAFAMRQLPRARDGYTVFSDAVELLRRQYPADYNRLAALLQPSGFAAENWSAVGDRVLIAYIANKIERNSPGALKRMKQQLAALDEQALDLMPAVQRNRLKASRLMIRSIDSQPAGDRAAVAAFMSRLDATFSQAVASSGF